MRQFTPQRQHLVLALVSLIALVFATRPVSGATPPEYLKLVTKIGSDFSAAVVRGDYLYAGLGQQFEVIDISDLEHPVRAGWTVTMPEWQEYGDYIRDIAISGDYAYLAGETAGIRIVDISDPHAPREVGKYNPGWIDMNHVEAKGNYVFFSLWSFAALGILDVSTPSAPVRIWLDPTDVGDLHVVGDRLYVFGSTSRVLDVSNPYAPRVIAEWDFNVIELDVDRNIAYGLRATSENNQVSQSYLRIFDIANPAAPRQITELPIDFYPGKIHLVGSRLYLNTKCYIDCALEQSGQLRIYDVSTPSQPSLLGGAHIKATLQDVVERDGHVYGVTTNYSGDAELVNLDNPSAPARTGIYQVMTGAAYLTVVGDYIYAPQSGVVTIVDVSTPTMPVVVKRLPMIGYFAAQGRYGYLVSRTTLTVLDLIDPRNPATITTLEGVSGRAHIGGTHLYTTGGAIVDISEPASLKRVGTLPHGEGYGDIAVAGNFVYITDVHCSEQCISGTLTVVDVTDPAAPKVAGTLENSWNGTVAVVGNYVYLADTFINTGSVQIADVSDPTNPRFIGYEALGAEASEIVVKGKFAYFAYDDLNVRMFDISNPAQPKLVAEYFENVNNAVSGNGLAVFGDHIFVSDGRGLVVLEREEFKRFYLPVVVSGAS